MTPGTAAAGEWSLVPLVDAALDVRVTGGQHPACPCNAINLSHQTIFIDRQVNERLIRTLGFLDRLKLFISMHETKNLDFCMELQLGARNHHIAVIY
jgi:hypothetical protein